MSPICKRSLRNNEFLDGIPITLIMVISRHYTEKRLEIHKGE